MIPTFNFKHLEPLDSIKEYASHRVQKLEKYALHKKPKIKFIFSVQKQSQMAEVLVDMGPFHFAAVATHEDLYTAIDQVVDKIERQLTKHKDKVQHHHSFEKSNEGYLQREIMQQVKTRKQKRKAV